MYAAMGKENPWTSMMGGADTTDEDQDTIKTTLLETNPYLLGLTVIVSLLHSVFEFLAFKNGKGFYFKGDVYIGGVYVVFVLLVVIFGIYVNSFALSGVN